MQKIVIKFITFSHYSSLPFLRFRFIFNKRIHAFEALEVLYIHMVKPVCFEQKISRFFSTFPITPFFPLHGCSIRSSNSIINHGYYTRCRFFFFLSRSPLTGYLIHAHCRQLEDRFHASLRNHDTSPL